MNVIPSALWITSVTCSLVNADAARIHMVFSAISVSLDTGTSLIANVAIVMVMQIFVIHLTELASNVGILPRERLVTGMYIAIVVVA